MTAVQRAKGPADQGNQRGDHCPRKQQDHHGADDGQLQGDAAKVDQYIARIVRDPMPGERGDDRDEDETDDPAPELHGVAFEGAVDADAGAVVGAAAGAAEADEAGCAVEPACNACTERRLRSSVSAAPSFGSAPLAWLASSAAIRVRAACTAGEF